MQSLENVFPEEKKLESRMLPWGHPHRWKNNQADSRACLWKVVPILGKFTFAVNSIRIWWQTMGAQQYPNANRLYMTADGGGSNGSRCRLWKTQLQALVNELGLPIEVSHFPPGTSKWNKIEHRMFSQITKNWRARPLDSLETIVSLISSTTTEKGLKIGCGVDFTTYETGIKVTDEELAGVNIVRNDFCGKWNYTVFPQA